MLRSQIVREQQGTIWIWGDVIRLCILALFGYQYPTWRWLMWTAETFSSIEYKPDAQNLCSCVERIAQEHLIDSLW